MIFETDTTVQTPGGRTGTVVSSNHVVTVVRYDSGLELAHPSRTVRDVVSIKRLSTLVFEAIRAMDEFHQAVPSAHPLHEDARNALSVLETVEKRVRLANATYVHQLPEG